MTPDYNYGNQTSYTLHLFKLQICTLHFSRYYVLMFILYYQYNQKTGLSVRIQTKSLWVQVTLQSLKISQSERILRKVKNICKCLFQVFSFFLHISFCKNSLTSYSICNNSINFLEKGKKFHSAPCYQYMFILCIYVCM